MIDVFLRGLESVFTWLLQASWQASVLVALVLLLQVALRGRLNPRWHHALWLLVVLRLVLPVLPESALSLFQFTPQPPPTITHSVTEPIFVTAPVETILPPHLETLAPPYPFSVYTFLALIWLTGALGLLVVTWLVNRRFARHVGNSPVIDDPRLLEIAAAAQAELGLHRQLRLIESAQINSPAIMGIFHPTLMLPVDVRSRFSDEELRFIFLHEFAHLKRGDLVVQWLIALLQILHWFNPVLWYAFRRMRIDREPATDALVLSRTGEAEKDRYGHVLIKLLEHYHQRHSLPTLVGILEDKDQFKRRFLLIGKFTRGAYGWSLLGVLVIIILGVVCLTQSKSAASPSESQTKSASANSKLAKPNGEQLISAAASEDVPEMTRLLKLGTDINYRGKDEGTPITKAAESNKIGSVKFLLAHGADPNSVKSPGWNYTGMSLTGKPEIADVLLAAGGNINATLFGRGVPLIDHCVSFGPPEMVKWFIAHGVDPKKAQGDKPDETLLFEAGSPEVAQILINHDVDVNRRSKSGATALNHICLFEKKSADIARVLLKHGADPNAQDNNGITPLMVARDGATVDVLVEYGADVKAKREYGGVIRNPRGDASRLKALIAHGAPFDPKTDGPTMMMDAAWLDHVDVIAYLLSLGVDPNQKGTWSKKANMYFTPLEESVTVGHLDAAKFLLEHGAKVQTRMVQDKAGPDDMVNALDNRRKDIVKLFWEHGVRSISELSYAISQGEPVSEIQKLLNNGIPPNPPQDKIISPLALAAELGQLDVVTLLVQRGAKINDHAAPDWAPIDQAAAEGQDEVVALLLSKGAKPDYQAVWNVAWNVHPYEDQRSKDHFEKTLKLLIDAGALKEMTPEQKGRILDAVIDTRYPGGNAVALKMLLDAGLSPELPVTDENGKNYGTVISYYRDLRAKTPHDDFDVYPLIDMLEAADKEATPKTDTRTQMPSSRAILNGPKPTTQPITP